MKEGSEKPLEFKLGIANTEQLLEEFGDLFERKYIQNAPIFVERKGKNTEKEERFFVTSMTLATIRMDEGSVWDLDMNDVDLLDEIRKAVVTTKIKVENNEENYDFDKNIEYMGKSINVTYEPYTEDTSEYIIRELEERR